VLTRAADPPTAGIDADHAIPPLEDAVEPLAADPDPTAAPAIADAAEGLFDVELDLTFPEEGFLDGLGS
jgi:hypothetical protein